MNISVRQGTLLRSILLLCCMNSLPLSTELLTFFFADDATNIVTDSHLSTLSNKVSIELQKILNWFRNNNTAVNLLKLNL